MDGIIVINKPKNYTSHDVVSIAKKVLKQKVGHTGTLDPNATGVLPLLIGKGTKLSKYLVNHDKTYEAILKLGIKTDTGDIWGNVIEETRIEKEIQKEEIEKILKSIEGSLEQLPPMYSAIKVKGKKLYEYARKNQKVEIPKRMIEIYQIDLLQWDQRNLEVVFKVKCSKGTYIRTLCETIAQKLGTIGTMKDLNRLQVGMFEIQNSISVEKLKNNGVNCIKEEGYFSIEEILKDNERIVLTKEKINQFLNGFQLQENLEDGVYNIYTPDHIFLGTGVVQAKKLKRDIIIKE